MPPAVIYAFQFEISLFIQGRVRPTPRAPCLQQLRLPARRRAHAETLSLPHLQSGNWLSSHFITVWRLGTLVWRGEDPILGRERGRARARASGRGRRSPTQVPACPQCLEETELEELIDGEEALAGRHSLEPSRPEPGNLAPQGASARAALRRHAEGTPGAGDARSTEEKRLRLGDAVG